MEELWSNFLFTDSERYACLTNQQHTITNYVNSAKWTMRLGRAAQKMDKIVIQFHFARATG